jgi:hypothetical protein
LGASTVAIGGSREKSRGGSEVHQVARAVVAVHGAGHEVKAHRPAQAQAEALRLQPHFLALGRAVRQHADALAVFEH